MKRDRERRRDRDRDDDRRDRGSRRDRDRKGGKFKYRRRDPADIRKQASQSGGMFDSPFDSKLSLFIPKPGNDYQIRILPPAWEDNKHFGFEHWTHSGGDGRYLCPKKMKGERCPFCEEYDELRREGDQEAAKEIRPSKRYGYWIIDRDHEDEGPKLWVVSWVVDRDITSRCSSKRTGEVLYIDDPDEGYDLEFKAEKKGKWTEIIAIEVARKSTPLSDDEDQQAEWLEYISENPLDKCLDWKDEEFLEKVLSGKRTKKEDDEEDDKRPKTRSRSRGRDEDEDGDDDRPSRRKSVRRRDDDDDDDDEDIDDEDEDLDEDRPKRRKSRDEDEDDDDDDDRPSRRRSRDDDDDEEDRPKRRRSRDDDDD